MPCVSLTRAGKPCRARPLKGTDLCLSHSDRDTQVSIGFGGPQEGAGRPRRPREIELIQEVADEYRQELRDVFSDGLIAERGVVVGDGEHARVEYVTDNSHRLATAKEILDRLHGKPTQRVDVPPAVNIESFQALIVDPDARLLAAELRRRVAHGRALQPGGAGTSD